MIPTITDIGMDDMADAFIEALQEPYFYSLFGAFTPNYRPARILKSGDRMIVFWPGGDKTVVKRSEGEEDSDYAAFTAALGIYIFGSNSALKRIIRGAETQLPKKRKETQKEDD